MSFPGVITFTGKSLVGLSFHLFALGNAGQANHGADVASVR